MTMNYSFRASSLRGSDAMVMCGRSDAYQLQIQDALNSNIKLLSDTPDPAVAPEPELADLAKQVNQFFEAKARALLRKKRQELTSAGNPDAAARSEVTVFLTDRGLQLGFSYAMEHKEVAPTPRKSLLRRVLGPLSLGRAKWTMPLHSGTPGVYRKVRWPSLFWLVAALVAILTGWFAVSATMSG